MHANLHFLKLFGMLGAIFFAAQPASAQCTDQWLPGRQGPCFGGLVGDNAVAYRLKPALQRDGDEQGNETLGRADHDRPVADGRSQPVVRSGCLP